MYELHLQAKYMYDTSSLIIPDYLCPQSRRSSVVNILTSVREIPGSISTIYKFSVWKESVAHYTIGLCCCLVSSSCVYCILSTMNLSQGRTLNNNNLCPKIIPDANMYHVFKRSSFINNFTFFKNKKKWISFYQIHFWISLYNIESLRY